MMDVSITEARIEKAIINNLLTSSCSLEDDQIVKRILLQLKELKLIKSYWSGKSSKLYWNLTPAGEKARNDMLLMRDKQDIRNKS